MGERIRVWCVLYEEEREIVTERRCGLEGILGAVDVSDAERCRSEFVHLIRVGFNLRFMDEWLIIEMFGEWRDSELDLQVIHVYTCFEPLKRWLFNCSAHSLFSCALKHSKSRRCSHWSWSLCQP